MTLSRTTSTSSSLAPFSPLRSLSSTYSDMYSGLRLFMFMNVSNAPCSAFTNDRHPPNACFMTPSYLSFNFSKPSTYAFGSFPFSGSSTSAFPSSLTCSAIISLSVFTPSFTCENSLCISASCSCLSSLRELTTPPVPRESTARIGLASSSFTTQLTAAPSVLFCRYSFTRSCSSSNRDSDRSR